MESGNNHGNGSPSQNKDPPDFSRGWPWLFEFTLWESSLLGYLIPVCLFGLAIMAKRRTSKRNSVNGANASSNGNGTAGIFWKVWQTVGLFALAITTLFLEFYLRILDHFQFSRSRSRSPYDDIDSNANQTHVVAAPVTWRTRLKSIVSAENARHICRFCQRLLTIQAVLRLGVNFWPQNYYNHALLVLFALILPRLIFAMAIVMKKRNLNPARRPPNPDRHVNMALMLLHYAYKGIRKIFKVLNGLEQIIIYMCQCIEFVVIQLLGYTYRHRVIRWYTELETLAVFCILYSFALSSFQYCIVDACAIPTEIVLMSGLYAARLGLKIFP